MRKRSNYEKHKINPDCRYDRIDVARFVNYLMKKGKKSVAEGVLYRAFDIVSKNSKEDPVKIFERALANASPLLEVVSRRVGGANYQVPREVRPERKFFLASRWIINSARIRKGKPVAERLADELIAAGKNEGAAIKKKQDMHRVAEANRAFASFVR